MSIGYRPENEGKSLHVLALFRIVTVAKEMCGWE